MPTLQVNRFAPQRVSLPADESVRFAWLACHILPLEAELRCWLSHKIRGLSRSDLDDIVQEAYANLWVADLPRIRNPRAFFYAVARNIVLEQVRRARVVRMERLGDTEALRILSDELGPDRYVGAREELAQLARAVEQLPARARRVFEMRKLEGLSQKEVAEQLGVSERTVEHNLARALARVLATLAGGIPISCSADSTALRAANGRQSD